MNVVKDYLDFWLDFDYRSIKSKDMEYVKQRNPHHSDYIMKIQYEEDFYKFQSLCKLHVKPILMHPNSVYYYETENVLFDFEFAEIYYQSGYHVMVDRLASDMINGDLLEYNEVEFLMLKTYMEIVK